MTKIDFDDFAIKAYSNSIYKTLKVVIDSKEMKGIFLDVEYKDERELKLILKDLAYKIAEKYVKILKSKGFPENEIPEEEQKNILKEVINEQIEKKR